MDPACTTLYDENKRDMRSVKNGKFKSQLDKFLELIPDEPKMTNYVTAARSNSYLIIKLKESVMDVESTTRPAVFGNFNCYWFWLRTLLRTFKKNQLTMKNEPVTCIWMFVCAMNFWAARNGKKVKFWTFQAQPAWVRVISSIFCT